VALRDRSGETVDSAAWSRPPRRGASWALVRPNDPHADVGGPAWEVSTEPFGQGDRGSPGRTVWGPASGGEGQAAADGEGTTGPSRGNDSAGSGGGGTGGRDSDREEGRGARDSGGSDGLGQTDTDGGSASRGGDGEAIYRDHLEFGTPRDGTPDDDYLMRKRQYALSYNSRRNTANWVAWNLNRTHFGAAPRSNAFTADPELPRRFARVVTSDYSGSGYSRGHMVRSEERTATPADNAATFLLTNILPQTQDLNAGPWLALERYLQEQAQRGGREIYVIAGGIYPPRPETLNGRGKVAIPTRTWKIAVLLPYGQGLRDVTSARQLRVIAVDMPNETGIATRSWRDYQTTVDALEKATGYDFLDRLPDAIETVVESQR
jgi:endonuclease G